MINNLQVDFLLFSDPYRWLIFIEDEKILNNIRALTDSDILLAKSSNDSFILKQFYKIEFSSNEIIYENYGTWNNESGIKDERSSKIISKRRENLRGKQITTSYVILNPNTRYHMSDFVDKNVDSIHKLNYIVINSVLDRMNTTRKELFQPTWGYLDPKTKKWSGMVGDIVHNDADIGGDDVI